MSAAENVIGGLLIDSSAYWRIAGLVVEQDFPKSLRPLFAYVRDTLSAGEKVDAVTAWEAGHESAVELASTVYSVANIEAYAKLVAEDGERSRIREAGQRIALAGSYSEAQALLAEVRPQQAAKVKSVRDGLNEMLEAAQLRASGPYGLTWAIPGVDRVAGLLVPARLYGIAARAKMGKTTTSLAPQIRAVLNDKRVLNFSLEMTAGELTQASLAHIGKFDSEIFEREDGVPDESWAYINVAAQQIAGKAWLIDDTPGLSLPEIEARAMQYHLEAPLDLIVVDHIGLVRLPQRRGANKNDELGEVSYGLKNLAKRLKVPVIALVQLNRNLESRADKRPIMPDLRDSGNLEQDFDCVVSVYRDEVYNPNSPDAGHAEITTMFNRHGRGGTAFVSVDMGTKRYDEPRHPRLAFPAGPDSGGSSGGGFKNFGAPRSQPRSMARASGDD